MKWEVEEMKKGHSSFSASKKWMGGGRGGGESTHLTIRRKRVFKCLPYSFNYRMTKNPPKTSEYGSSNKPKTERFNTTKSYHLFSKQGRELAGSTILRTNFFLRLSRDISQFREIVGNSGVTCSLRQVTAPRVRL